MSRQAPPVRGHRLARALGVAHPRVSGAFWLGARTVGSRGSSPRVRGAPFWGMSPRKADWLKARRSDQLRLTATPQSTDDPAEPFSLTNRPSHSEHTIRPDQPQRSRLTVHQGRRRLKLTPSRAQSRLNRRDVAATLQSSVGGVPWRVLEDLGGRRRGRSGGLCRCDQSAKVFGSPLVCRRPSDLADAAGRRSQPDARGRLLPVRLALAPSATRAARRHTAALGRMADRGLGAC